MKKKAHAVTRFLLSWAELPLLIRVKPDARQWAPVEQASARTTSFRRVKCADIPIMKADSEIIVA